MYLVHSVIYNENTQTMVFRQSKSMIKLTESGTEHGFTVKPTQMKGRA